MAKDNLETYRVRVVIDHTWGICVKSNLTEKLAVIQLCECESAVEFEREGCLLKLDRRISTWLSWVNLKLY